MVEREKTIYLVLEFGEIDLATVLAKKEKARAAGLEGLDENFIRLTWQQMLQVRSQTVSLPAQVTPPRSFVQFLCRQ